MKTSSARMLASLLTLGGVCYFAPSSPTQTSTPHSSPPKLANSPAAKPTPYQIVERGANHQVWERYTFEKAPDGSWEAKRHRIVQLGTGINYLKNGRWVASQEQINILPQGGAEAVQGQHQAYFPGDIYQGVVQLVTPDGKRLRNRPIGISYDDGQNTVLIAQLKDSVGELAGPNQVVYPDAFTGIKADLVYTYRKGGFEQDVVLREQPPSPESLGLNPQARLQLLTEFTGSPEPAQKAGMADRKNNLQDATLTFGGMRMVQGRAFSINDRAGAGRAKATPTYKSWVHLQSRTFLIEEMPYERIAPQLEQLPTTSRIDRVDTNLLAANSILDKVSSRRRLPPAREAQADTQKIQLASADWFRQPGVVLDYVALDTATDFTFQSDTTYYVGDSVNLSGLTTIEGGTVIKYDTNYTCAVNILGTIKCATSPYRPAILTSASDNTVGEVISISNLQPCTGTLNFTFYNQMGVDLSYVVCDENENVLVSREDSNSSDTFSFSTGLGEFHYLWAYDNLNNNYFCEFYPTLNTGQVVLDPYGNTSYSESGSPLCTPPAVSSVGLSLANGGSLNNLNIRNLGTGVQSDGNCSVTNLQFVLCGAAFDMEYANLYAGNVLMSYVGLGFAGRSFQAASEHLTFDHGLYLGEDYASGGSVVALTNSLLTGVSSYGNVTKRTNAVVKLASGNGVYQTVGAGSYYLATNSPYHHLGTTTITPALKAQLSRKTTWPPIVYTGGTISTPTTLSPQAPRDTNTAPDLGYHYDPLDYVFGGVEARSNVVFTAGTAVGWYDVSSSPGYGLIEDSGVTVIFNGTATAPCWLTRYDTVQETGNGNWRTVGWGFAITANNPNAYYSSTSPRLVMNFTKCSSRNFNDMICRDYYGNFVICADNCEFYGAAGGYNVQLNFTNCLFYRFATSVSCSSGGGGSLSMQNCTTIGGGNDSLKIQHGGGATWPVSIRDCAFDGTTIRMDDYSGGNTNITDCDFNAFLTGADRLAVQGAHDVVVNGFNWQTSWSGNYYLPLGSPLVDTGGVTADSVGLYHFTIQTNLQWNSDLGEYTQIPETNSVVDIGYHYVATDAYGNPLDSNGDGISDYLEDANGNGWVDDGETNWTLAITQQPTDQMVVAGTNATLSVTAIGTAPLSYQWYCNGEAVTGAISATLTITNAQTTNGGSYYVVVSNDYGSIASIIRRIIITSGPYPPGGFRGVDAPVYALAADASSNLYAGGYFTMAGSTWAASIARWNPSTRTWSSLDQTPSWLGEGVDGTVNAIAIGNDGKVYVGGSFLSVGGGSVLAFNIAAWDPSTVTWANLNRGCFFTFAAPAGGRGAGFMGNGSVNGFCIFSNLVYVVGNFRYIATGTGIIDVTNIAVWNTTTKTWSAVAPLPSSINRPNTIVTPNGTDFYVGGTAGIAKGTMSNGTIIWHNMDTNIVGDVSAICFAPDDRMFIGGSFHLDSPIWYKFLAQWNGTNFVAVPGIYPQSGGSVNALTIADGNLIMGGNLLLGVPGSPNPVYTAENVAGYNLASNIFFTLGPAEVPGDIVGIGAAEVDALAALGIGALPWDYTNIITCTNYVWLGTNGVYYTNTVCVTNTYYYTNAISCTNFVSCTNYVWLITNGIYYTNTVCYTNEVCTTNLVLLTNIVWHPYGFGGTVYAGGDFWSMGNSENRECVLNMAQWDAGPNAWSIMADNAPPVVSLTRPPTPVDGAVLLPPASISVIVEAADDCRVTNVALLANDTLLGNCAAAPYYFNWNNISSGSYAITAVATDNNGATGSASVSIRVDTPPTVSITGPPDGAQFTAPANITTTANASDSDGTVTKVDFYQGATRIGTATTAPYSCAWNNVPAGTYSLTAVATDNDGASTTSAVVTVSVHN